MSATWRVIDGDCRDVLSTLDAASVHCCVTSPPYFGLRDYGHDGQIGLEPTPDEFVTALVEVFREVRRVLRDDGTLWLNLGDSYAGSWGAQSRGATSALADRSVSSQQILAHPKRTNTGSVAAGAPYKPKDLLGIPWMVAFALRADGWWLRSEIIWAKPNPMPESVTDRPTKAHEQVFLLSKSARYFYDADAIREPHADGTAERYGSPFVDRYEQAASGGYRGKWGGEDGPTLNPAGRNKRSVWTVATQPFAGAHFATFPPKLIEPCILAGASERCCSGCGAPWRRLVEREDQGWDGSRYGERAVAASGGAISGGTTRSTLGSSNGRLTGRSHTTGFEPSCECGGEPVGGTVLDPFAGAGTTGMVALRHGRSFVGVELNPEYAAMARERIIGDAPLLNSVGEAA